MDEKIYFHSYDDNTLMYRCWYPKQSAELPAIVLLHGAASNSTRWWHFVEHSRLTENRMLLRPDLRGNGESIWYGTAGIDHWVQDIASMLQHEKQERAIVLGHCLGANVALNFAARYPEMCAGLILVEPMMAEAVTGKLALLKRVAPVVRLIIKIFDISYRVGLYRRYFHTVDLKKLDQRVHQASADKLNEALADHGSPWLDIKTTPLGQYINNLVALLDPLPIGKIQCPSLIMQANGISMTDAVKTKALLSKLPEAEFLEIDTEHWIPASHPEILYRSVDNWIMRKQKSKNITQNNERCSD